MVAKIITGKSLRGALQYNENKVLEGKAELILASGFAGNIERMNFAQKLHRFENRLLLKPSVETNTLHISLNFDSAEKLTNEKLQQIALIYMEKIGFSDQPFIAYRHYDAGHDHIHLVTTNIQANSKAIDLHNIGCVRSEKARKEIEEEYQLVKAQSKHYKPEPSIKSVDIQKVVYGRRPTKRAISNTVNAVLKDYRFTSLSQLNAVLKQFNVIADRGSEDTAMFQNKGLIYSLLDEKGNKVGVPIKSSSLYTKPTLTSLEKLFVKHEKSRLLHRHKLKQTIDEVLRTKPNGQTAFTNALKEKGIAVVFRVGLNGQTFGLTFVDHKHKSVVNGSELGKAYAAKPIQASFISQTALQKAGNSDQLSIQTNSQKGQTLDDLAQSPSAHQKTRLLDALLKDQFDPSAQLPKRKKKRKLNL